MREVSSAGFGLFPWSDGVGRTSAGLTSSRGSARTISGAVSERGRLRPTGGSSEGLGQDGAPFPQGQRPTRELGRLRRCGRSGPGVWGGPLSCVGVWGAPLSQWECGGPHGLCESVGAPPARWECGCSLAQ